MSKIYKLKIKAAGGPEPEDNIIGAVCTAMMRFQPVEFSALMVSQSDYEALLENAALTSCGRVPAISLRDGKPYFTCMPWLLAIVTNDLSTGHALLIPKPRPAAP